MSAFDKVIGYEEVKKELMQLCDMMRNWEVYERLGAKYSRGLLLEGEPGLGKSLMAQCFIEESGRKSFLLRRNKPDGDFVKEIHRIFREAADSEPSIILLDDMDKFVVEEKSKEEYVALQTAIDEVASRNVYVIATANGTHNIPNSLLRAGRFDRKIHLENPKRKDAERIIEHYLSQKALGATVNASDVAKALSGRSCAELETVLNEAAIYAGSERSEKVEQKHILEAILREEYNVTSIDPAPEDDELVQIACHESGHVAMQELLCEGGVGLASILPGRYRREGFIVSCAGGRHNRVDTILISLSGLAAVELRFGRVDGGSSSDLRTARRFVRHSILEEGYFGLSNLELDCGPREESSEISAGRQEAIVGAELERYRSIARSILAANRAFLDQLTGELLKKQILLNSDIRRIRESCKISTDFSRHFCLNL